MAESSTETLQPKQPVLVALSENTIGEEITDKERRIKLAELPPGIRSIYIETASGNIYRVDQYGIITDMNNSLKQGRLVTDILTEKERSENNVQVGLRLAYGSMEMPTVSSPVQRIVLVREQRFQGQARALAGGKEIDPIRTRFVQATQPLRQPQPAKK